MDETHGIQVKVLTFDFAGLDDFLGQHLEGGLFALSHAQLSHAPHELALCPVYLRKGWRERGGVVAELRPIWQLPDITGVRLQAVRLHAVIMPPIHRIFCGE
jgi:hypothetical protein